MAYTSFPAYAQFLTDGYAVKTGGGLERTEMSDGYIEQPPSDTRGRVEYTVTYRLASLEERHAFEAWRRDALRQGAQYFAWPVPEDPSGATVCRARIVNGEVAYAALTDRLDEFTAAFTVETWV